MTYAPAYKVSEVVQMRREGLTYRQIGQHFRISSSRVGHIIKDADNRARQAARAADVRQELHISGDCSKKLAVEDVLCLLDLSRRAKDQFEKWCESDSITELNLFDLMDMLIPVVERSKEYYDLMPAYKVHGLGQKIYAELIKSVSALDCGDACEKEWTARKKRLKEHLMDLPGFYPYILRGRSPALLEE